MVPFPRKRRTREHVIADLSVNHAERHIIEAGHIAQRTTADYGFDLIAMTFDERGYAEPDFFFVQLKASESLARSGENSYYDVDVRDYNLWMKERFPVFLILYDARTRKAYWIHVQGYFQEANVRRPKPFARTIRILVDRSRVLNRQAIAKMRAIKQELSLRLADVFE